MTAWHLHEVEGMCEVPTCATEEKTPSCKIQGRGYETSSSLSHTNHTPKNLVITTTSSPRSHGLCNKDLIHFFKPSEVPMISLAVQGAAPQPVEMPSRTI